jgi:broad specificity phosphatase PhoE
LKWWDATILPIATGDAFTDSRSSRSATPTGVELDDPEQEPHILLVSHAATIRCLLKSLIQARDYGSHVKDLELVPNTGVFMIEVDSDGKGEISLRRNTDNLKANGVPVVLPTRKNIK